MTPPGTPVRVGVLGCSAVARRRFLPALVASTAELTAVASRDFRRAGEFAGRFGCAAARDYEELLRRDDVDAVYVSVPTGLHRHWALAALRAGKHVLVEKPLATSRAEGAEVLQAAEVSGRLVMENRMFAHHSQHETVTGLLRSGVIGELRVLTAAMAIPALPAQDIRYRADLGGGALLDVGYYPLHAALRFAGANLVVAGAVLRHDPVSGVDVSGTALLQGERGVAAQLTFGFEHAYRSSYELWGERGRIVLERAFTPPSTWQPVVTVAQQDRMEQLTLAACDQFRAALEAFVAAVRGERDLTQHQDTTLAGLGLLDAVRQAALAPVSPGAGQGVRPRGREWVDPPVTTHRAPRGTGTTDRPGRTGAGLPAP